MTAPSVTDSARARRERRAHRPRPARPAPSAAQLAVWAAQIAARRDHHRRLAAADRDRRSSTRSSSASPADREAAAGLLHPGQPGTEFGSYWLADRDDACARRCSASCSAPGRHRVRRRRWAQSRVHGRGDRPVHQDRQRDPAHRARLDLHGRVRPRPDAEDPAGRRAGVLRGLLQRLPGRARGGSQHPEQRAGARRLEAAHRQGRHPALGADLDHRQPAHRLRLRHRRRDRRRGARRAAAGSAWSSAPRRTSSTRTECSPRCSSSP